MKKILLITLLLSISCNSQQDTPETEEYLIHPDWAEDVRNGLNSFISENRTHANTYAIFDFDNSSSIFDIEEQLMVYQLQTMSFAMDPETFHETISTGLKDAPADNLIQDISTAYSYLYTNYGPFTPSGLEDESIQDDPIWLEFAAKTGVLYQSVADWTNKGISYQWVLYLFTGMTEEEVYDLSYRSYKKFSAKETSKVTWESPSSIESLTGQMSFTWTSGVSVTDNIRELFKALDNNGIDVWICSASGIQQVMAAIDAAKLHNHCHGILGMTIKTDSEGKYIPEYDTENGRGYTTYGDNWVKNTTPTGVQTGGPGKVTAIQNVLMPLYGNNGPSLGLMDSTGDFFFCTEFSSMQAVVCMNRADRKITDGGGLIAEIALYEKETLGYTYQTRGNDTFYLLQGRDENGLRSLYPSNATLRLGSSTEQLLANEDNYVQLQEMIDQRMTVGQAINTYATLFTESYPGYHCY